MLNLASVRSDTPAELELVRELALVGGADAAVVSNHWAKGGDGAKALAEALVAVCEGNSDFKFLYDLNIPIAKKIEIIAKEIYGADGIELSELAQKQVETYTQQGYDKLPSSSSCRVSGCYLLMTPQISLHGQNAILLLTRPEAEGRTLWVHCSHSLG